MEVWILVSYLGFLYLMTELILNAIEEEEWWLAISLVITMIGTGNVQCQTSEGEIYEFYKIDKS